MQKENLSVLENRISPSYLKTPQESNSLSVIQKAISNQKALKITYQSISKSEITNRTIKAIREFTLDRILAIQTVDETIEVHADFDLSQYFKEKYKH